ncbi:MAG: hypothetical protein L3K14_04145 [Thermoplasmata archaeon]|nr:hypothetical protein [Thermoplasmata archaeon]
MASGLLGVALLLLLAPLAEATASGTALVTIKAPFTGATSYPSSSLSSAGCGVGKIVRAPFFNLTNGRLGFSERAHANTCPGLYGDSGYTTASETVSVPIPAHSGTNSIHATWTLKASIASQLAGGTCALLNTTFSYCYAAASAQLYAYAYLIDTTNFTYWFGTTPWTGAAATSSLYDSCYLGNCTSNVTGNSHVSVNQKVVWSIHAKGLVASHVYILQVSWYSYVDAYDYTYDASLTGASESGLVTMAGPGSGAVLNSITIR